MLTYPSVCPKMRYRPEQDFGSQPGAKGSLAGGNLTDAQTCVPKEATKKLGQPARAEERRSDALADEPTSARGKVRSRTLSLLHL